MSPPLNAGVSAATIRTATFREGVLIRDADLLAVVEA
jgi:hypothetical protein